jgi:GTP-binding protein
MFVDRAVVTFIAGDGGNGCISFRREKFVPKGGPDGGDGGDGGTIILISKSGKHSLVDFKFRNIIRSLKGRHGSGAKKSGKNGQNEILPVPAGTVVKTYPDEKLIFDFDREAIEWEVVRGGKGGRGNIHFKSARHQTPRIAEPGGKGETIKVILELKLIAFAGLVGIPNAGKSTLISKLSAAKPKIADYPFTTLIPHLGVVYNGYNSLVMADIPGIIKGAHRGEGMGQDFLRHIERNKLLVFLIDLSVDSSPSPLETFEVLRNELKLYKTSLTAKKFMVVGNKIDLVAEKSRERVDELKKFCRQIKIDYVEVSALKGINLDSLKKMIFGYFHEK